MILAIVGPTAVGKTKLSIKLAKIYNGEIINCDSMQIYKDLNIGTAKVTKEEMEHIPHHLLSIKEVEEDYSIFDYQKDARNCMEDIKNRNKIPIFVGGSGLYLKSALYDYEFLEEENQKKEYGNLTNLELLNKINAYETGIIIEENNRKRLERTLFKLENGWIPKKEDFHPVYEDVIYIGLTTDRNTLYQKINQRFEQMLIPLIDEVKPFYQKNIRSKAIMTGIGYKELYSFFDHSKTLAEVVEECKKNSRNYAKRQYTWFENQMPINWFQVNYENFDETVQNIVNFIESLDVLKK